MPIKIVGQNAGKEYEAANELAAILQPALREGDQITLIVGAKCWGQERVDIDIVLLAEFGPGMRRNLAVPAHDAKPGALIKAEDVYFSSLAVIIEVKDHSEDKVEIEGGRVFVSYGPDRPRVDATKEAWEQIFSLRNYILEKNLVPPHLESVIWLRNYPKNRVPKPPHNILAAKMTADDFFRTVAWLRRPVRNPKGYLSISCARREDLSAISKVAGEFVKSIKPTALDRKRLERLSERLLDDQKYADKIGAQLLVFRGHGGSGKTVHLLRLAKDLYDQRGARILLLTFNKALVADIRRLFALMGIGNHLGEKTIWIRTGHSYFVGMLDAWGEWSPPKGEEFPEEYYETQKDALLKLMADTEIDHSSIQKEKIYYSAADVFGWDYIFVDESQDWPENERQLLFRSFGPGKIVVADGIDQMARSKRHLDWREGLAPGLVQLVPLRKSLRMKSDLSRFVSDFAGAFEMRWDQEPNNEVPGGEVIVHVGAYDKTAHDAVMKAHREMGNEPIDALFCVPSGNQDFRGDLATWGANVWDGTEAEHRLHFANDVAQHRVVRYESCRGLEGWTVVCLGFDAYFESEQRKPPVEGDELALERPEVRARRAAALRCLIPLTRAIDTLVLQVSPGSELCRILEAIAREHPERVAVRRKPILTGGQKNK